MNINVFQVQIVFIECPFAHACRLRRPVDNLAERFRREMRHGRDYAPTDSSSANVNPSADFYDTFQYN
jgi:hypothetical protein